MLVVMITISEGPIAHTTLMASQTAFNGTTQLEKRVDTDVLNAVHAMQEQYMKDGKVSSMSLHDPSHIIRHE